MSLWVKTISQILSCRSRGIEFPRQWVLREQDLRHEIDMRVNGEKSELGHFETTKAYTFTLLYR